jgi:hypothetical protein
MSTRKMNELVSNQTRERSEWKVVGND